MSEATGRVKDESPWDVLRPFLGVQFPYPHMEMDARLKQSLKLSLGTEKEAQRARRKSRLR